MGWSRKIAVVLGLWLGPLLAPMSGHAAPDGDARPPKIGEDSTSLWVPGLAVWVAPTVPEGKRIGGWVEERGAQVLSERQPPLEPQDLIHVAIRGGPYDYQIHIALLRSRHLLSDQPDVIVCECRSEEMLDRVGEAIDAGARQLTVAAVAERAAEEERAEAERTQVTTDDETKHRKLGALGYVGIGMSAVGVGLLGAGILVALRPDDIRSADGQTETRSWRGAGIGLAAGGGTAIAAGVSLLIVDLVRRRKRAVTVAPALGPSQVGVAVAWLGMGRLRR